jgi:hypothetical protein
MGFLGQLDEWVVYTREAQNKEKLVVFHLEEGPGMAQIESSTGGVS